jgi:hypothetical protein
VHKLGQIQNYASVHFIIRTLIVVALHPMPHFAIESSIFHLLLNLYSMLVSSPVQWQGYCIIIFGSNFVRGLKRDEEHLRAKVTQIVV